MGSAITYPDGTELLSSALTLAQINAILWAQTMGALGYVTPGQPADPTSSKVRTQWPTTGAPFQQVTDDVCYVSCLLVDEPYDKIRDVGPLSPVGWGQDGWGNSWGGTAEGPQFTEQWSYTRVWEIKWCFYGPNSLDLSRALRSALYQEYLTTQLGSSNLFPVSDFPEAIRVPELINAQWWERVDFKCLMYEFVTETINKNSVASVEVIVSDGEGNKIADITPNAAGYGEAPFGQGVFV